MATTRGYVQRMVWLSGPLTCVTLGPAADSAEALFVQVRASDDEATMNWKASLVAFLTEAQLSGREVTVTHGDSSAEITAIDTGLADLAANPLQVDAVEVTQAIQDLGYSVPLIADKPTVVRVYLSYYSAVGVNVSGTISVRMFPSDPPLSINSENTVALLPADAGNISAKRNDASKSLNFVLPASRSITGALAIVIASVTNTVTLAGIPIGGSRTTIVRFFETPPLRVRIVRMRYTMGTPPVTYTPSAFHVDMLLSWLARAYPVGRVVGSVGVADVTAAVPGFSCNDINAQLAAIRALDVAAGEDQRTHYYGCVDDGGYWMRGCAAGIPGTVASGPTGPATWGWDFDGSYGDWYGGHELGHTYGRLHPGFCGESADDLNNYPFPSGLIGTAGGFCGFDVGDQANSLPMAALPGTVWKDVMTYCDRQWVSPYTYMGVRTRLLTEDRTAGAMGAGEDIGQNLGRPDQRYPAGTPEQRLQTMSESGKTLVSIVAVVNLARNEGHLRFVNPLERGKESGLEGRSAAVVRAKASDGAVLSEYPVTVKLSSELTRREEGIGVIDSAIILDKRTASIELLINGQVADSMTVGGRTPSLPAVRVAPDRTGHELTLAAQPDTTADRNHRYSVQVSTDRGRTWHTVAVGLTEPRFNLDRSQFKEGDEVQLRVLVTNGLETTITTTQTVRM